jgi:hypothetical protein
VALTEVYVDPSIAADSGTGTIGDPYGDLEYAIEQTTFDTTNGTRVNIKAGTDEVLAAKLETALADSVTTPAWVPSHLAPCVIQGYGSTAGDGSVGGISGGGSVGMFTDQTADFIILQDLHVHNVGANHAIHVDSDCLIRNVEVSNGTGTTYYGISVDQGLIEGCYVHNWEGYCFRIDAGNINACFVYDDGATPAIGIQVVPGQRVTNNIIWFAGTHNGVGIQTASLDHGVISNNSIFSNGGTGSGINVTNGGFRCSISNNLVEGFSGVGGIGLSLEANSTGVRLLAGNAVYDCTTAYDYGDLRLYEADNETLTASPFTNASAGDFSPVDTGNVFEGALPQIIGGGLVP